MTQLSAAEQLRVDEGVAAGATKWGWVVDPPNYSWSWGYWYRGHFHLVFFCMTRPAAESLWEQAEKRRTETK